MHHDYKTFVVAKGACYFPNLLLFTAGAKVLFLKVSLFICDRQRVCPYLGIPTATTSRVSSRESHVPSFLGTSPKLAANSDTLKKMPTAGANQSPKNQAYQLANGLLFYLLLATNQKLLFRNKPLSKAKTLSLHQGLTNHLKKGCCSGKEIKIKSRSELCIK